MGYKFYHLLLCILILAGNLALAEETEADSVQQAARSIEPLRLALVGGAAATLITASHVQNYNSWWKGERSAFHFGEDGTYTLGADKVGHFFFAYVSSDILGRSLIWSGVDRSNALLYGGLTALAFQTYVEIEDGYTKVLGFSPGDALANISGAAFPWIQEEVDVMKNFSFKWNYIRSEKLKQGHFRTVIDDYESQYFWMSLNLKELAPSVVPDFWPAFLPIALGYSVKNLDGKGGGEREFYIALDYDFTRLPGEGTFLSAIKHLLNYFHFPAPTIRITPSLVTYGLRF